MADVIPWGEWRPDVSPYKGQHSPTITNAYPRGDGYGPVPAFSALASAALPAASRGLFTYFHTDGTIRVFAGTSTRLYLLNNSTLAWDDVTRADATALDLTGLTDRGDMSSAGGLAAAFDGTTAQG